MGIGGIGFLARNFVSILASAYASPVLLMLAVPGCADVDELTCRSGMRESMLRLDVQDRLIQAQSDSRGRASDQSEVDRNGLGQDEAFFHRGFLRLDQKNCLASSKNVPNTYRHAST
jgi:hypothetical protein